MDRSRLDAVAWIAPHLAGMDRSFDRITRLLVRLTGVPTAYIALVGRSEPVYLSAIGLRRGADKRDCDAFARACVDRNEQLVVGDATRQRVYFASMPDLDRMTLRFYAGVPVRAPNGMPIGALCLADGRPGDFDGGQPRMLRDLQATLEELLLLRTLAVRDPFTGLYSRRYFDELLELEWRRARRRGSSVSLLRIAVDRFQDYLAHYGSGAGDDCLAAVATDLRATFRRAGDVAARLTGDELVVLLPATDGAAAALLGDRLRARVARRGLQHLPSASGQMTISIGCAAAVPQREPRDLERLVSRARDALELAIAAGGDRLVSDAPSPRSITASMQPACWG